MPEDRYFPNYIVGDSLTPHTKALVTALGTELAQQLKPFLKEPVAIEDLASMGHLILYAVGRVGGYVRFADGTALSCTDTPAARPPEAKKPLP